MLLLGGLVSITGDVFWEDHGNYSLEIIFPDARGLGKGSFVFVSGVKTGKVSSVALSPEGVHVILSLPEGVGIPRDSSFIIATGGLLGESEIHVERGNSLEAFQPGDMARGYLPPSFDRILSRVEEDLQELRSTFRHINDVLESPEVKENLQKTFNDLPLLLSETREATAKISTAVDSFTGMTEMGKKEMARIGENVSQAAETLTRTMQENRLPLNETIQNLRSATGRIETILADFDSDNNAGTELRETLSSVRSAAHQLEDLLQQAIQALSGEGPAGPQVSHFRDVIDKAGRVLDRIDNLELGTQFAIHQVTSGNDSDRLLDLSLLLHEKGANWSLETGFEDLGENEKFNALLGWRFNDLMHLRGGIVRGDIGGGMKLDFRNTLKIPVTTTWLWWDENGGQWKTDTFLEIERNWGILYRHLHLDEDNRDSLGLFYRF